MLISEDRPDENKLPIVARFAGSCLLQRKCVERGDRHVLGLRASSVVENHFRRLDAAIYGLCPVQEAARAILGIAKSVTTSSILASAAATPPDDQALSSVRVAV